MKDTFNIVIRGGSKETFEYDSLPIMRHFLTSRKKLPSFTEECKRLNVILSVHFPLKTFRTLILKLRDILLYLEGDEEDSRKWRRLKTSEKKLNKRYLKLLVEHPMIEEELQYFSDGLHTKLIHACTLPVYSQYTKQPLREPALKDMLEEMEMCLDKMEINLLAKLGFVPSE